MNIKFFIIGIFAGLFVVLSSVCCFAEENIKSVYSDVAYASLSKSQVCNIYLPKPDEKLFPVIILVHGGGFAMGSQNDPIIQPVIKKALEKGYAVFSVDYRKSSEAVFIGALADVKAAVRFIKANAGKYNLDSENLTIWGESAGAYLSVMTALTPEVNFLNGEVNDNINYSSSVKNLVSFYAPVEFFTMDSEFVELGLSDCANHNDEKSFESRYLGQALNTDKEKTYATYWATYSDDVKKAAKFLRNIWIQAGSNDKNVPYTQSKNLSEKLPKILDDTKIHYELIDGAGHMDTAFYTDKNLNAVFDFIEQ